MFLHYTVFRVVFVKCHKPFLLKNTVMFCSSHLSFSLDLLQNTAFSSATRLFSSSVSLSPLHSPTFILSIFLPTYVLIVLYFRLLRLHPSCPSIISFSTHPLHQSQSAIDDARSASACEALDRFAAAVGRTLQAVASFSSSTLSSSSFFFYFFTPLRQS